MMPQVYATKQAIKLPRAVSSIGYCRHELERREEGDHSEGLASAVVVESSVVGGGELTSAASSRAASALDIVNMLSWVKEAF